jgi:SAM-dependent methyltransferase
MTAATAYQAWDRRWATEEGRADWLTPEPFVMSRLPLLRDRGARSILDLGCGVGRHALALAAEGFEVSALDGSPAGLAEGQKSAEAAGLTIDWREGQLTPLPYADAAFDAVLSWNVIYHGDGMETAAAIAEIRRVLRPHGLFLFTMLTKRNARFGDGREIAPDTFVIDGEEEKDHAHFYVDLAGLGGLLAGFQPLDVEQREHKKPGSWHWHILAERA